MLSSAQDPIRAVVMSDRVILIVPEGADSLLAILDRYMKEWVSVSGHLHAAYYKLLFGYLPFLTTGDREAHDGGAESRRPSRCLG